MAALRRQPGIEVAEDITHTWLRGRPADEKLLMLLAAIPATARYEWYPKTGRLRLLNERIPAHMLPEASWQPLAAWLQVDVSEAALPGNLPEPVVPELIRSANELESSVLLTTLTDLEHFVLYAPQVRFERLQFAATDNGHALIRGTPLPPVAGRRYVLHEECIAVPAGFAWMPAVSAKVLKQLFNVNNAALILWNEDGTIITLPGEQFIPLTRRAFLATQRAVTVAS